MIGPEKSFEFVSIGKSVGLICRGKEESIDVN
jgi:hypothetical protein